MRRRFLEPRPGWRDAVEGLGFDFHTIDGETYWDEGACWEFAAAQIDTLEDAADEVHRLCMAAAAQAMVEGRLADLGIPEGVVPIVAESWERGDPSLYGRFDFAWNGEGPPKLLEYNADTPTALLEASVVQWQWLEERFPEADQFNSLHEALIERWQAIARELGDGWHFTSAGESAEDAGTAHYLLATALEAELSGKYLPIEEIGWDAAAGRFVDSENFPIARLFKLYPWDWLLADEFGNHVQPSGLRLLEPAWKLLLSGKGLLALLWEMFPDHPNLLPASILREDIPGTAVQKPLWGREGANMAVLPPAAAPSLQTQGPYQGPFVYQAYHPLAESEGRHAVLGLWMIGDKCHGMGIREDDSPVTRDTSRFVPHLFR